MEHWEAVYMPFVRGVVEVDAEQKNRQRRKRESRERLRGGE